MCIVILPGQYYDEETGLHYNYHRYYDPKIGRYLRADPIGLRGGINPYTYAENNSINYSDPMGLAKNPNPDTDSKTDPPKKRPPGGPVNVYVPLADPMHVNEFVQIDGCMCPEPLKDEHLIDVEIIVKPGYSYNDPDNEDRPDYTLVPSDKYKCLCKYKDCNGKFTREGQLVVSTY